MGITALFVLLAVGLVGSPARAAAAQNLSGDWLNSGYTLSTYQLHMSADGQTLTASWGANIGSLREGLVGSFTGTLNASGTTFAGPTHVTAGSLRINGTMTVTISSQQKFGFPLLTVSYQQDNGVNGSFTLEIWLLPPKVSPISSRTATFEFDCPGPHRCQAGAEAQVPALAGGGNVGAVHFTISPGATRTIRLSLNQTGRALLAKRGALHVQVLVVALKKSSTLPPLTKLGTITFHFK